MYQRILLAVDGSRSSDLALSQAIIIAKATGAEVKALFVVDDSDVFFEASYFNPKELIDNITAHGRKALDAASARLSEAGVRNSVKLDEKPVAPGRISLTIVTEADAWNADLIVLGTHGRRGVRRLLMGSVSEGVLAKTSKPVLLVRSEVEG
ncbi:universal stress protein UspA family [Cupriavidus necator N-1]|jgi:nucleotide-binding universal stress UspA family protein|uniref:Universal stress protein n=1 Tax=Cupriavidus necator (strain ATCC 43291 / DSM 13513 / CCUG 52238 / LMG 8453 / N-1) TaxID=1042878 RepID=F8GNF0_CUPNN|nr:universal stress protein [Cupriavidus necator]AEI80325.1 universal stress protein UspA family [Cupriavidus necator N-1]KAI3595283.1 Universal stress protein family [Cupriavidus necator H850]MDX6010046.1 universal stress protein [Cupriavidus necator]RWA55190.1 universal stress protein UspA [Cupriavidus sp. UYMSc13B]